MKQETQLDLNRRDFLRGGSMATLMMMMGGVPLNAAEGSDLNPDGSTTYTGKAKPFPVGVIGCGSRGREIIKLLTKEVPFGPVVAVCDTYPAYLRRSGRLAPEATKYADYQKLLADEKVRGVIVATPTHQHTKIVLDALKAGKHVHCEAPLAHTIEEVRTIAKAAHQAVKSNFQPGLQFRSEPQRHFMFPFMRSGAIGKPVHARTQWHKKTSWRPQFIDIIYQHNSVIDHHTGKRDDTYSGHNYSERQPGYNQTEQNPHHTQKNRSHNDKRQSHGIELAYQNKEYE